jgi:hypothetical protein
MKDNLYKIISDKKTLIIIYLLAVLAISIQSLTSHPKKYYEGGPEYKTYNNYTIFERSYHHLKNNQDLYILYPQEHWDLYKYTPSFAVFFAIFSVCPDWLGLILWNLLNALIVLLAVYALPKLRNYQKGLLLIIILFELIGNLQNQQSNALIAGLIILSFAWLEKNKAFYATLCLVFATFIKLFGLVGFSMFLLYRNKARSLLYTIMWTAVFLLAPLIFIDADQYVKLCRSYMHLLANDHSTSNGYSVMAWLNIWLSADISKILILAIGIIIFLLPFLRIKMYSDITFKYLLLSSILCWVVIFNHKAEPATFVIAMAGVALWFINSEKSWVNIILFITVLFFTSIAQTDIFPKEIRDDYLRPYRLKAVPCILVWFKIIYDLLAMKEKKYLVAQNTG